ncbi:MAG: hypothetical protein WCV62_02935 [Candidatus Peribacteraceae bacterium]|jgi:uncharacterized repeat protein (TIGR01451 family)
MPNRLRHILLALLGIALLSAFSLWMAGDYIGALVATTDRLPGVVDDTSAQFKPVGKGWKRDTLGGYGTTHALHAVTVAQGNVSACWTAPALTAGPYRVYATWPQNEALGNVTYTVEEGKTVLLSRETDQGLEPQGEVWEWMPWQLLGEVSLEKGKSVRLCVSAPNATKFAADAVRFVSAERAQRAVSLFPSGTYLQGEGAHPEGEGGCAIRCTAPERCALVCGEQKYGRKDGGMEGQYDLVRGDTGTVWTFEDVSPGEYAIHVTWPANVVKSIALARGLDFTVTEKGTIKNTLGKFTLPVQELTKAPSGPEWEGERWKEMGTVRIGQGDEVQILLEPPVKPASLQDVTSFAYPADAVALVPKAPLPVFPPASAIVADDGGPSFSMAAPRYWESKPGGYGFGHKVLHEQRSNEDGEATWSFGDVHPGTYEIFATWPANEAAETRASFRVREQGQADSPLPSVDMSHHPRGALRGDSLRWQRVGTAKIVEGKNVRVTTKGGVADAVALLPEGAADVPLALKITMAREGKGAAQAGTDIVYNIALFNESSTHPARGVVLHAKSPEKLTFDAKKSSPECAVRKDVVLCSLGDIALRTTRDVRIVFMVPDRGLCSLAVEQQVEARLQSGESFLSTELRDIVACTPSSSLPEHAAPERAPQGPDLVLIKTGSASVLPGGIVTYMLTAKNVGAKEATKVVVSDFIPDWLTFVPADSDPSCVQEGDIVYCRSPDRKSGFPLPPGEEKAFRVSFAVPPTAKCESIIANRAGIQDAGEAEEDAENNGSMAMTRVACPLPPPTPISVSARREGETPVRRNSRLTYAVTVKNDSEALDSGDITLRIPLPPHLTFLTEGSSNACRVDAEGMTCILSPLKPGRKADVHVAALAASDVGACDAPLTLAVDTIVDGNHVSHAVAPTQSITCPAADLVLGLAQSPLSLTAPGKEALYTLTLRNDGPEDAMGASAGIPLPPGLTLRKEGTSPLCSLQDSRIVCGGGDLGHGTLLRRGEERSYPIAFDVASDHACGEPLALRAIARLLLSQDPVSANDWAEARTPVECLSLETGIRRDEEAPVSPGEPVGYVTTVENPGRLLEATGVKMEFFLPLGFTFLPEESDHLCYMEAGRMICDIGTMPPGDKRDVHTIFAVSSSIRCKSEVEMGVQVRTERAKTLPKEVLTATVSCPTADLSVSLTGSSSVVQGMSTPLTLTVMNHGPQQAQGVRARLILPPELALSPSQSDAGCKQTERTVTCNGGSTQGFTLNVDEARSVRLTIVPSTDTLCGKSLRSEADIQSPMLDEKPENDSDAHNVRILCEGVNIVLTSESPAAVHPGQPFSVTYRIINRGPDTAAHVNVRSSLPAGTTFNRAQSAAGCRQIGTDVFCTGETLEGFILRKDEMQTFTVSYGTSVALGCASRINMKAEALTSSTETDGEDNAVSAALPVKCDAQGMGRASVDLSIESAPPAPYPSPGKTSQFGITVRNAGPDIAKDVFLSLTVPLGFRLDTSSAPLECAQPSSTEIICGAGGDVGFQLGQGQTVRFTVPVLAPSAQQLKCGASVRTAAGVRTSAYDTNPLNDATQGLFPALCPYDPFGAQ